MNISLLIALQVCRLVIQAQGSELRPRDYTPIELGFANADIVTNYTFYFLSEVTLARGMNLAITFPVENYEPGLLTSTCQAKLNDDPIECQVFDCVLAVVISQSPSEPSKGLYSLQIQHVLNPKDSGLTGYFALELFQGSDSIAFNDLFGQIAITPAPMMIPAFRVLCVGLCVVGEKHRYSFRFSLPGELQSSDQLGAVVPSYMGRIGNIQCSASLWPRLKCVGNQTEMLLKNWENTNETVFLEFHSVRTSPFAGRIGFFQLFIVDGSRSRLKALSSPETGPLIYPNRVNIDKICPNAQEKSCPGVSQRLQPGSLTAVTIYGFAGAAIPKGGMFFGNFTDDFSEIVPKSCHVLSGLEAESSSKAPLCQVESRHFRIVTTDLVPKGNFAIELKITTPSTSTGSLILAICAGQTYTDVIALLGDPFFLINDKTRKLSFLQAIWSNEQRVGEKSGLALAFRPHLEFSRMKKGKILVKLPTTFILQVSHPPTLDICSAGTALQVPSYTYSPGLLEVTLSSEFKSIPATCTSRLEVTKGIDGVVFPAVAGDYTLELILHNGFGEVEAAVNWVEVKPQEFLAVSVLPLAREAGELTVLSLSFTPTVMVPKGVLEGEICGQIVLEFQDKSWAKDLGTGLSDLAQISCQPREHITAISGKSLVCTLHHSQATSPAYITIENFNKLQAEVNVLLEIGGIANPAEVGAKPLVQVSTGLVKRYILTVLNWAEIALPATLRTSETGKGMRGAVLLNPATVNSVTQLRLALISYFGTSAGAEVALILQLPSDFTFTESGFSCKVQGKASNCTNFPTSQLIVIYLADKVEAKKEFSLAIRGLYTPRHVVKPSSLKVRLVVNNAVAEYVNLMDFPALLSGNIAEIMVVPDSSEAGDADNTLYFLCYIEHPLYFRGKMRVHFPQEFDLTSLSLDCSITEARSKLGEKTECRAGEGYVEIDTFYVIERSSLVVKIAHIPNPNFTGMTGSFGLETLSEQFLLIDAIYGIQGFILESSQSNSHLRITALRTFPSNRNIMADVIITFQPATDVPAEAVISISLPISEYPELPQSVDYKLSGGLIGQGQCQVRGTVLEIGVEKKYHRTQYAAPITMYLKDLTSQNAAEASGPVSLKLIYKGKVMDESENSPVITYSAEPLPISVTSFNVSPKTHLERAKYRFVLQPSSDLPSNRTLSLRFGAQFPRKLGNPLYCVSKALSNSLDGSLSCKESNRVVTLTVTKSWTRHSESDLIVTLANILNPAPGHSLGPIVISTLYEESWVDSTTFTPNVTLSPVPSPMTLVWFNSSSYWTGERANVSLQVAALTDFSELQLFTVIIDFPLSFHTGSNTEISCGLDSELYPCFVAFNRIYISINSFMGETIQITNIANPKEAGLVAYPTVSLYVSESDIIVAKTVDTFPLAPLVYQQSACNVVINRHQPLVQNRGIVSPFLPIAVREPAKHDFVLTYKGANIGIQVFPQAVLMQKGEQRIEFQVSISQSVLVGNYLLEWTVSGFSSCPPQQLHLQVVDRGDENFLVNSAETVTEGQIAENNAVLLLHAPAEDFYLRLVQVSAWPQTVRFYPEVLHFAAGETYSKYSVLVGDDSYGEVLQYSFEKEGRNAEAFRLPAPVISTKILPKDSTPPVIADIQVTPNRTSADISIFTDKPAVLSLMVTWRNMRPPSISQLMNQTFPGNSSAAVHFLRSNYSTKRGPQSYIHRVEIAGLRAQTAHNVFVVAANLRMNNSLSGLKSSEFTTLNYHRTAYAILRFWVSKLTVNDHETLLKVASECLNIPPSRFLLNEDNTFPEKATIQLILISDPEDTGETTPLRLLSHLQECGQTLKAKIPTFDNNLDIDPVEFPYRPPRWRAQRPLIKLSLEGARFENLWLDMPGTIYICVAYYVLETDVRPPTSYQISQGLDAANEPCLLPITTQESWVLLTNLQGDSAYNVFLTAGNAVPGLPDLMPDSEIQTFTFKLAIFKFPESQGAELWKTMSCALGLTLSAWLVLGY